MAIFLPYYLIALALLGAEMLGLRPASRPKPRLPPWLCAATVVVAYAVQLGAIAYAARTTLGAEPWRASLPIGVASPSVPNPDAFEALLLALALLQTLALAWLPRGTPRGVTIGGCAALIALAFAAPAFESPDAYAYVGNALMGIGSYAPPPGPLPGDAAAITYLFHPPLLPAPYGPLWLAIVRVVTGPFAALGAKLLALRALGAFGFLALLAALRAAGVPARVVTLAALNPALVMLYVGDAHNDVLGLAAIAGAAALLRSRYYLVASAAIAVAGLIKLPFALLGLPVLAAIRSRTVRYALAALAPLAAATVSWYAGGAAYFAGLRVHVPVAATAPTFLANLAVAAAGLAALAVALARGCRRKTAVWPIAMMSSYVAMWYLPYGLPYALGRHRILTYLLVALPFACAAIDAKFMRGWTWAALAIAIAAAYAGARGRTASA